MAFWTKSKDVFQAYIKTFLNEGIKKNIKQKASGWPSECDIEEKIRNYLQEYMEHGGI